MWAGGRTHRSTVSRSPVMASLECLALSRFSVNSCACSLYASSCSDVETRGREANQCGPPSFAEWRRQPPTSSFAVASSCLALPSSSSRSAISFAVFASISLVVASSSSGVRPLFRMRASVVERLCGPAARGDARGPQRSLEGSRKATHH